MDYGIVFQGGTIRGENLNLRNLRGWFLSSRKEGARALGIGVVYSYKFSF